GSHGLVIPHGRGTRAGLAEKILTYDHYAKTRRADVLLCAGIDEAELLDIDRPGENRRRHVRDQRHRARLGYVRKLHAAYRLVGRVVQVSGTGGQLQTPLIRHAAIARRRLVAGDVDLHLQPLCLADRLLRPGAGIDVIGDGPGGAEIHRDGGELTGRAALEEEHLVARGHGEERAHQALGLLGDGNESLAAVTDFHHRGAAAAPVGQLLTGLLEDFQWQRRRSGGEIEYAHECPSGFGKEITGSTGYNQSSGRASELLGIPSACRGLVGLAGAAVFDRLALHALDPLDADEALTLGETDEPVFLCVSGEHRDLIHRGAYQRPGRADEHDLLAGQHLQRRHCGAVAVRRLHRDDALAAAPVHGEVLNGRALAVPRGGGREYRAAAALAIVLLLAHHDERDDFLRIRELDAAHTGGLAAHRADLALVEADGLAPARNQHDLALAVGDRNPDEPVLIVQIDGDDATRARAR